MQAQRTTESNWAATSAAVGSGLNDEQPASMAFLLPLRGVVYALVSDPNLQEDFIQEAAAHFLELALEPPAHTFSWYIHNCYYHIRHLLQSGSSIDSHKRARLRQSLTDERHPDSLSEEVPADNQDVVAQVAARDATEELERLLSAFDCGVLENLVEGFGQRELATHLGVSHTMVNKSRQRIASVAIQIGFCPEKGLRAQRRKRSKK